MSSRTNYNRYGGVGGGDDFMAQGDYGLLDLIAAISGKNKVSGGPVYNTVTKQWEFQPYQGSTGFLGNRSRAIAKSRNTEFGHAAIARQEEERIAKEADKRQQENKLEELRKRKEDELDILNVQQSYADYNKEQDHNFRLSEEQRRFENEKSLEDLRNRNVISQKDYENGLIRAREIERANLEKGLKTHEADETRKTNAEKQQGEILGRIDVPFSKENAAVYDRTLSDLLIKTALQQALLNDQISTAYATDPGTVKSAVMGKQFQNLAPAFNAQHLGTINTPADTMSLVPQFGQFPDAGMTNYNKITGPLRHQELVESGTQVIPEGQEGAGTKYGGTTKVVTSMLPGLVQRNVNISDLIKQVQNAVPKTEAMPATNATPSTNTNVPSNLFGPEKSYDLNPTLQEYMKLLGY